MKKLIVFFFVIFISVTYSNAQNACTQQTNTRIRLVGDSWLHFPQIYQAYDSALAKYGFPDVGVIGDGSVLISMTAETWWQFPLAKFALDAALTSDANRPIDLVIVSLGGNDVGFGFHSGDSLSVVDDDLQTTRLFMDSIFDFIHKKIPKADIIWQCYDYPNFQDPCIDLPWNPYCDTWVGHGHFTAYEVNRFLNYFTAFQDSVITGYHKPYMHFFNCNGLMQWHYGQTTPLRYAPFGTYPPRTVPFPGGNINYPTPHIAMGLLGNDAYHLGPDGYTVLAEFYVRKFISNLLRKNRDTTFYSLGQNYDGWADETVASGTGNVYVGKNENQKNTKGIFTFNTATIPANKKVKKAILFLRAKTQKTNYNQGNIFPQNFVLDIKSGTFGNDEIEGSDFAATASLSDIACFVGNLRGNGYTMRAELNDDALQYINKNGLTQFRLSITDNNFITFYNGDTTDFESPYLDLYYDTTSLVTAVINRKNIKNAMQVFPNPATNEISLLLNKDWKNKELLLSIYDTKGVLVLTKDYNNYSINQTLKINIESLPAGSYFISVENNEFKTANTFTKLAD